MLWIKGRAQKALNIASNWAHNQELQFSSKKTEIVLFTNKRKPDFGTLRLNGRQLEISKEATLLGVTLDRSWPSGWCIELRSWLRGFDAQLGHLHDACTSLPQ